MSVKLFDGVEKSITAAQLKDGQIAQIVDSLQKNHIGWIVQAYGNNLVTLGNPFGKGWDGQRNLLDMIKVIPLPDGTKLEIIDN